MPDPVVVPPRGYALTLPESPDVPLEVVGVTIRDALDDLFHLEVTIHSPMAELAPRDFMGQPLCFDAPSLGGLMQLRGIVATMRQELAEPTGVSRYRLTAVPALWLCTLRKNSRIFQHQSVIQVIHTIVGDYAGRIPACGELLGEDHPVREYMAQYGETDWDMIRRKAADAGVTLWAAHDGSGRVMLADDLGQSGARVVQPIPYRPVSELRPSTPHILAVSFESRLSPGATHVRDYDYRHPVHQLDGRAFDADTFVSEGALELFEHAVGRFQRDEDGQRVALLRLEEGRVEHEHAIFTTNVPAAPGTVFTLVDHPRADANIDWLVVRATTYAGHADARHQAVAIPAAQRYRPRRRPPPRIISTQTAVVVGPPEEEIDVDSEGRVCLRFRWDRRPDGPSTTRRVRVSQSWAGPGYGLVCLPRIGDEVVVMFLDGDPDEPIIVGRVHNGLNPGPLQLPAQKAWSTWRSRSTPGGEGFNEITLDDAAGAERIYVHAQRDAIVEVEHDVHARIEGDVHGLVCGNSSGAVKGSGSLSIDGDAELSVNGGDLTVTVSGEINASAGADFTLFAGDERRDESTNHHIHTGGLWIRGRSAVQVNTPHFHVFSGDIKLTAGGSFIHITSGGITIESGGDVVVNGAVIKLN